MNSATFSKLVIIAITLLLLPASQAFAATITVTSTCSLPSAVASAAANSDTEGCVAVGAYGDDTIILNDDVSLASEIQITSAAGSITINGNGNRIDAGGSGRHFRLRTALTLNLNNVEVINGNEHIGSIYMQTSGATVNIANSRICSNTSPGTTAGGAFWVGTGTTLNIRNSVICDNEARHASAINVRSGSTLTVASSVFYGNTTRNAGAISVTGNATITNSVFYNNRATNGDGQGGAIYIGGGTAKIDHATLTGNRANEGAAIFIHAGVLEIRNSISYGNIGGTTDNPDCRRNGGTVNVNTGNLFGNSSCTGTTFSTANPRLIDRTSAATPHYALQAGSPAIDAVPCLTGVTQDQLGTARPQGSNCDIGAFEYVPPPPQQPVGDDGDGDSGRGDDGDSSSAAQAQPAVKLPPPDTCAALFPEIQVSNYSPGTNCQRVTGWAIGHPDLIAAHPDPVVDVWGWITPQTQVCFPANSGRILFVDTTAMPRTLAPLPAFTSDGMLLCATINRAGQVALIADGSPPAFSHNPAPTPAHGAKPLSDCMVRTEYSLNFRDAPAGHKIGGVPHNAVLTALARTDDWFKVDYHGAQGWIAARYVAPMGICG